MWYINQCKKKKKKTLKAGIGQTKRLTRDVRVFCCFLVPDDLKTKNTLTTRFGPLGKPAVLNTEQRRNSPPLSEFGAADGAADCRSSWAQWKTKVSGDNDPTAPRNNNKLLCQLSAKQHARQADHQTDLAQGQRGRCVPRWQITTGNCATASPADLTEGHKLLLTFLLHWMFSLCLLLIRLGEV